MKFYKILKMEPENNTSFYNLLEVMGYLYIEGNLSNSFAIEYNPENYNKLLYNDAIFKKFKEYSIQQLIMTNQKYLVLSKYESLFRMRIIDCLFDEDPESLYLDEIEELSSESISYIINNYGFNIKEIVYITKESRKQIVLQKNGVLGIDDGLTCDEEKRIAKFIDTLNFGLRVIKIEKDYI